MWNIYKSITTIFQDRNYVLIILSAWIIIFALMFYLPVRTIPSNSISFQAGIWRLKDYVFLGSASILSAFIIAMQIKIFRNGKSGDIAGNTVLGGTGLLSGIMSSLFGTATCGLCVGALFGFLGANSVIFLINNKGYVVFISFIFLALSIYFSSKKLNNSCDACRIN